jgi:hypothetical protein
VTTLSLHHLFLIWCVCVLAQKAAQPKASPAPAPKSQLQLSLRRSRLGHKAAEATAAAAAAAAAATATGAAAVTETTESNALRGGLNRISSQHFHVLIDQNLVALSPIKVYMQKAVGNVTLLVELRFQDVFVCCNLSVVGIPSLAAR